MGRTVGERFLKKKKDPLESDAEREMSHDLRQVEAKGNDPSCSSANALRALDRLSEIWACGFCSLFGGVKQKPTG